MTDQKKKGKHDFFHYGAVHYYLYLPYLNLSQVCQILHLSLNSNSINDCNKAFKECVKIGDLQIL